jgi:poly-gamma-glutamate synthesis protein (capsule biosynthesis protein)
MAVCGDLVPTGSNAAFFARGEIENAMDEGLLSRLMESDARVINLETPLTDGGAPIVKAGPALRAGAACATGLARLSPVLALANNHILDQGSAGLLDTIHALEGEGLACFGAGKNLSEASKPYIVEKDGLRVGVLAVAEREFSVAGEASPGANPFDPLETPDHVMRLKAECDYVVVLYHGGVECTRYPSPMLRKTLRKIAEKGASLIVCQHTHCVGCFEEYMGATIVYGQGNLLFDRKNDEYWRTALVVMATFGTAMTVQYVPVVHEGCRALLAQGNEARAILDGFHARSREILTPGFIERMFSKRSAEALDDTLYALSGKDRLIVKIDRKLGGFLTRRAFTRRRMIDLINRIECEALREQLLTGLKGRLGI